MGLIEFLRQWPRGRLAAGVAVSVAIHLAVVALLLWGGLPASRYDVKRGEPLFVELPKGDDSPPPGVGGAPAARPAAPAAPAAPSAPTAIAKPAPRPAERRPAAPAPRPEPERRVASAPLPKAPDAAAPATPPAPPQPDVTPPAERPATESASRPAERQVASVPSPPSAPAAPNTLTALRRGSGGAGGRGEGRAGIEGEPIPLDSSDPKYTDYLDQVRRRIKEKWGFPCVKNDSTRQCEYKTTQLLIEFGIAKDGKVPFVTVLRSSGYPIYDDYAVNAVKLASPFPPIPDTFSKKGVPIHATFSYVVESSLANILR
jgi:TonB family protein